MSFPANHLLAYMASLAKEHNVAIVGSIVFGRKPSSLATETPAISPFEHLPTSSKQEARAPSAQVQQAWLSLSKDFIKWGATEEAKEKAILKNTAVYLEAGSGELVGNYEKRNLWHPERCRAYSDVLSVTDCFKGLPASRQGGARCL
jgi:predicted amidohydrolase